MELFSDTSAGKVAAALTWLLAFGLGLTYGPEALKNIKTLRGLLPICASCKKIRDDKGYWNGLETYIHQHTEAEFTHGICPECMQKLYPGLLRKADKQP